MSRGSRIRDLLAKMWQYGLSALDEPSRLPWLIYRVLARRAHLGELLRLSRHRRWLEGLEIRTVIDVGAHGGEFASAARAILPAARIYSFEPQDDARARIVTRLGGTEFEVFGLALGAEPGRATFYRSEFTKASSLLPMGKRHREAFPWSAAGEEIEVQVETLDAMRERLTFDRGVLLKLDVQGSELAVLQGGERALDTIDYILVEVSLRSLYDGDASFTDVASFLEARGFRYTGSLDQLADPQTGELLQQDAFFVRR